MSGVGDLHEWLISYLPPSVRLFNEVCAALPDHWKMFCPAARGVLWDGETSVACFWGLAAFVRQGSPGIGQDTGIIRVHGWRMACVIWRANSIPLNDWSKRNGRRISCGNWLSGMMRP